jgi:class 3 adenylate cyclase
VRGNNDIAWIGRAANHAAKLTSLPHEHSSYITSSVFDQLHDTSKFCEANGTLMWEKVLWTTMENAEIYRSAWWWRV